MEIANGVDAVEIGRVAKAMERPGFVRRFFSEEEQDIFGGYGIKLPEPEMGGKI